MPRAPTLGELANPQDLTERASLLSRSAALSQKAALQMPFAATTPPVKMRLERSAERDKREIINNSSAEYGQSASGGHSKSSPSRIFAYLHRMAHSGKGEMTA